MKNSFVTSQKDQLRKYLKDLHMPICSVDQHSFLTSTHALPVTTKSKNYFSSAFKEIPHESRTVVLALGEEKTCLISENSVTVFVRSLMALC